MPFIPPIPPQPQYKPLVDTKANILATTPNKPKTAFASDTSEFFVYDGSNWQVASIALSTEDANPDAGAVINNDKQGYGEYIIQHKALYDAALYDTVLGANSNGRDGAIGVDWSTSPPVLQLYYDGQWNDFRVFTVDGAALYYSVGTKDINTYGGNGDVLGANGLSVTQQGVTCAGACPAPILIKGV